ncbi:MAG: periplasmic copper chaperone [Hyphomicrobiales bacterium]
MKRFVFTAALAAVLTTPALAHVVLERKEATVGASYKAVLIVPHGCAGSATTRLRVKVPEGFIAVKPMPKPGWTIDVVKGAYENPYPFMHGMTLTEGVREVSWTGRPDDGYYDEFVLAGFIAAALKPGDTLYFPAVQECEQGVARWIEIPAAGQSAHALDNPAPGLHLVAAATSKPATFKAGDLVIEAPWIRATPKGAQVAGGYMKITNTGKEADRLLGGTLDQTRRFEVHQMTMAGDVMQMRPLPDGFVIQPGETVELKPGGYHVMGLDLQAPFANGQTAKGTLQFEKAGTVQIEYAVVPVGGSPQSGHQH